MPSLSHGHPSPRSCLQRRTLAVLIVTLAASLQLTSALRCVRSGMCSRGQLKPYVGDVSDSEGLRAAADARSHNKELVLILTLPNRILDVKLLVGNFARLGMEHILLMGDSKATCKVVAQQLPHVGCAWDTLQLDQLPTLFLAWHVRYRTLARLVHMGYNVLMTDSDVILFDDPYRYWKAAPFSNFTIIGQPELLTLSSKKDYMEHGASDTPQLGFRTQTLSNGGLLYVQNARPDGVAAWMLAEVTDRALRWMDDNYTLADSKGVAHDANTMDQSALNDVLSSVATGFPHFLNTLKEFMLEDPNHPPGHWQKLKLAIVDEVANKWRTDQLSLPRFMQDTAAGNETTIKWLDMLMPHTQGKWPEEYGGRWYPERRGPLSQAFQQLLLADCPGCPIWPDIEDPSTLERARALPAEKYLLAPPWMMCGYNACGSNGAWLPDAAGRVPQLIGHCHYIPNGLEISKLVFRQFVGRYDWTLAEEHWGTQHAFQANMLQPDTGSTPFIETQPTAPRLLVFYSRVRLSKLNSMEEYVMLMQGAMQVAALSNRTLVWPDMPCDLKWVGSVDVSDGLFTPYMQNIWYPLGERGPNMRCMLAYLMRPECVVQHRGMLSSEYDHFVQRFGVTYDLEPSRGNTAFFPVSSELHGTLDTSSASPASVLVEVAAHDARSHLDTFEDTQVVFLGHPVKVADYDISAWSCLGKSSHPEFQSIFESLYTSSNTSSHALPGRVVGGRLTTQAGLSQRPTTTPPIEAYRAGPVGVVHGPDTWCKPQKSGSNKRVRRQAALTGAVGVGEAQDGAPTAAGGVGVGGAAAERAAVGEAAGGAGDTGATHSAAAVGEAAPLAEAAAAGGTAAVSQAAAVIQAAGAGAGADGDTAVGEAAAVGEALALAGAMDDGALQADSNDRAATGRPGKDHRNTVLKIKHTGASR